MKEVIYVQYTNPGGYPPLEHSSDVFLSMGLRTLFLGVEIKSLDGLDFPDHDGRMVRLLPWVEPGLRRKLLYLWFVLWSLTVCIARRPALVYCSDAYSCPVARVLKALGRNVLYHEHDAPQPSGSVMHRWVLKCRRRVLERVATLVPSDGRRDLVVGQGANEVQVVWNCPSSGEVEGLRGSGADSSDDVLRIVYQGTIVPDRVPRNLVRAMISAELIGRVELKIIGYETQSGVGLLEELERIAADGGAPDAVEFLGPLPRHEMLRVGAKYDVGLSLMPMESSDVNMTTMIGASNKPFDYLVQGLPMICSDLPDWRSAFSEYAVFCDPTSVTSIRSALIELLDRPEWRQVAGVRGRARIAEEWNYEQLFLEFGLPLTGLS